MWRTSILLIPLLTLSVMVACGLALAKFWGGPAQVIKWDRLIHPVPTAGHAPTTTPAVLEPGGLGTPDAYGRRVVWYTATSLTLSLCVLTGVICMWVAIELIHAHRGLPRSMFGALVLLGIITTILAAIAAMKLGQSVYDTKEERPVEAMLRLVDQRSNSNTHGLFPRLEGLGNAIAIFVAGTLGLTLLPIAAGETRAAVLGKALLWQRRLLYVIALLLVVTVVHVNAQWSWPLAWAREEAVDAIKELALRTSASWGVIYSAHVLAMFLAAYVPLQDYIRRLACKATQSNDAEVQAKWLNANGLASTRKEHFAQFFAVIGPALAGGPLAAIVSALGQG